MKENNPTSARNRYFLEPHELVEMQNHGEMKHYAPGEIIFSEGEEGRTLFFLVEGNVQTFKASRDSLQEIISIKGPGEILGELSLSGEAERFDTAQALGRVSLLKMEQQDFLKLSAERPQFLMKVVGYLSSEVRDADLYRISLLEKKNEQIVKSYEELKKAQDELMKRERLAAVGSLASKIIHDIKGTITPLKVYSENLDTLTEEARRFGLLTIRQSINRILRICEELLEFVRGAPLQLEKKPCQIREFVEHEVDFLNSIICTNNVQISLEFEYDGEVVIDSERLGRVLQNLLINAKDAMPKGGTIRLRTGRADDFIIIKVMDTGIGISDDMKEKIFEPFVTAGKKRGTGLGLSISRKIMEEHGGKILVESAPGEGATFSLFIPAE